MVIWRQEPTHAPEQTTLRDVGCTLNRSVPSQRQDRLRVVPSGREEGLAQGARRIKGGGLLVPQPSRVHERPDQREAIRVDPTRGEPHKLVSRTHLLEPGEGGAR